MASRQGPGAKKVYPKPGRGKRGGTSLKPFLEAISFAFSITGCSKPALFLPAERCSATMGQGWGGKAFFSGHIRYEDVWGRTDPCGPNGGADTRFMNEPYVRI